MKTYINKQPKISREVVGEEITYGTPYSDMLKHLNNNGFKPIGITVMMCEETFIFKTKKEAEDAWQICKPEGWFYDYDGFLKARKQYATDLCGIQSYELIKDLVYVYWLDKRYEEKEIEL